MRLMPMTVYVVLLAVTVVLLLGSTWVLNRAAHPKEGGAPVQAIEPSDRALAEWTRESLDKGLTPERLISLLLLLASERVERSASGLRVDGTKLTFLPVVDARRSAEAHVWRGALEIDSPAPRPVEIQLDCRHDETSFSIDASLLPQGPGSTSAAPTRGVALIVNPPNALSLALERNAQNEPPTWDSVPEGRRTFALSSEEVSQLGALVRRLVE